jgi:uncharacterized protein with PQ loop repeat
MNVISALYSTVGIIIFLGYLPQILKLIRSETDCREISLLAWLMWDYVLIVSILYGVYEMHDFKFILASSLNCFCINMLLLITLYKRRKYGKKTPL